VFKYLYFHSFTCLRCCLLCCFLIRSLASWLPLPHSALCVDSHFLWARKGLFNGFLLSIYLFAPFKRYFLLFHQQVW